MLAEYNQHTPATDALQQDLGDLMNTSSDEDHKSLDPHVKLLQRLDKIGDMLEARVSVCEKWEQYDSALKGLQAQLESLQKRLNNASGIAAEEVSYEHARETFTLVVGTVPLFHKNYVCYKNQTIWSDIRRELLAKIITELLIFIAQILPRNSDVMSNTFWSL